MSRPRFTRATLAASLLSLLPAARPVRADVVECVLARVNDEIITLSDYERQRRTVLEDIYRQKLSESETQRQLDEAKKGLLQGLIDERLLLQKARDTGLSVTPDETDRLIKSIMDQNRITDETVLAERLKSEGLTLAMLRGNIERRTLIEKLRQFEVAAKIVVTEEEAQRYYDQHKDDFREPERLRLREIVLLSEKRDPAQVRKEIEEIGGLINNGADFAELATLFSQAPTAEHGGDLGLVRSADLAPDIAAVAAELKVGQVSSPHETKYGYHLVKLEERKPVLYRSFQEVHDEITQKVQASRYGEKMDAYLAELREAAFVKLDEDCQQLAR